MHISLHKSWLTGTPHSSWSYRIFLPNESNRYELARKGKAKALGQIPASALYGVAEVLA